MPKVKEIRDEFLSFNLHFKTSVPCCKHNRKQIREGPDRKQGTPLIINCIRSNECLNYKGGSRNGEEETYSRYIKEEKSTSLKDS